jgi:CRISPR-associated endonuclease Csy4
MDHYLDIRLRPDPEFPAHQLMDALFAKLHRALVRSASNGIGLSFPEAKRARASLGICLRLHGSANALSTLAVSEWLSGMRDHTDCTPISAVPADARYIRVRRVQAKSSAERLRRRQMKRKGWTAEQAKAAYPDSVAETLDLPFLTVRSTSTSQAFRLFIDQQPAAEAGTGSFNAYGLSTSATLPSF